jgi:Holliday junction resolvase RusA-like endonuclease
MYTPDTADEMKDGIRRLAMQAMANGEWQHTTGPVEVVITARFQRPASHYRRVRGSDVLKQGSPVYHDQKPDADNVAKAVMDALGPHGSWPGVWDDDKRVAVLTVHKMYASPRCSPSVDVTVWRLSATTSEA